MDTKESKPAMIPLDPSWRPVFESIVASLKKLVKTRDLDPHELAATARLIYALERMPYVTEHIGIDATLEDAGDYRRNSLTLQHSGDLLSVDWDVVTYGPQGTEREVIMGLRAEAAWGHTREDEDPSAVLDDLTAWADEWANRVSDVRCRFSIHDGLYDYDWEQSDHIGN